MDQTRNTPRPPRNDVQRERRDRCPGILRPWPAEDGLLLRLRLVGGHLPVEVLRGLVEAAEHYGDGRVRLTNRANLQLRGFPASDVPGHEQEVNTAAVDAIRATGLLEHPEHDLVRNVMTSPLAGLHGGRADLRPLAVELDRRIVASELLTQLPGKFLFVLDDGRGDLLPHFCDLGLVALDQDTAQLRLGEGWGEVLPLQQAPARLVELAEDFVRRVGANPHSPWHVEEYEGELFPTRERDERVPAPAEPLPFGPFPGGRHVEIGSQGLNRAHLEALPAGLDEVVVTPWYGIIVPER